MDQLFRLAGGVERDPAVEAWFELQPPMLGGLAREWFDVLRACGADVRELMHDGCPTACVGDAAFGYVNAFTSHVNVGFFLGARLKDPSGLLQGTGKRMRHVKLRPDNEIDREALAALVTAGYREVRRRL